MLTQEQIQQLMAAGLGGGALTQGGNIYTPTWVPGGTTEASDGGYTFASKIASAAAEFSSKLPTGAYIAAGFVLFILTFIVNALARAAAGGRVSGG